MARNLSPKLNDAMINGHIRRPSQIIYIYDVRSDEVNLAINDVVLGTIDPALGRDFTADVVRITVDEEAGDYIDNGIAASSIGLVVEGSQFDPLGSDALNVWLRAGNVVRIWEGDLAEPDTAVWPMTFTGVISGQPGFSESRPNARSQLTVVALGREARALKYVNTSSNFTVNTSQFDMAEDIATNDMGLSLDELDWPTWGLGTTAHLSTQFIDEEPIVSIARLMFPEGFMPRFNGEGKLSLTNGQITKAPARVYLDDSVIRDIVRPPAILEGINKVVINGLSDQLSDVVGNFSKLATASATLGYFTQYLAIAIQFSDDGTAQARNTGLRIIKDINGLIAFGGQRYIETPQRLESSDSTGGNIYVNTGFHPAVLFLMQVVKIATAAIPDAVIGFIGGSTISIGRLIEAATDTLINMITSGIGHGSWEIWGNPIEWVYAEIESTAQVKNLRSEDTRPITIENHLINSEVDGEVAAIRVLRRERAKLNQRTIQGIHDLALEPDDVFETANGKRYMISSISRTLERGGGGGQATYQCFEVTTGVRV